MLRPLVFASAITWLANGVPVAAQRQSGEPIRLRIPESVGAFAPLQRKDYDDPALGIVVRYGRAADSLMADVYFYPGPDLSEKCDLECATKVIEGEIRVFVEAFPELVRRRYVDTIYVARHDTLTPPEGVQWRLGRHLSLVERRDGKPMQSDFYVYYLQGTRVKVRATYAPDSATATAIREFAAGVVPAVTSATARSK